MMVKSKSKEIFEGITKMKQDLYGEARNCFKTKVFSSTTLEKFRKNLDQCIEDHFRKREDLLKPSLEKLSSKIPEVPKLHLMES